MVSTLTSNSIQKYKKKSVPDLIKKATEVFNAYIRKRDSDEFETCHCISCGSRKSLKEIQAGHYLSAGHNQNIRFDENNVHGQCVRCNYHLHGNQAAYRENLIKKIGLEEVEEIEQKAKWPGFKHDRLTLIDIITTYSEKIKHL